MQSEEFLEEWIYDLDYNLMSKKSKTTVLIMMSRFTRPITIKGGGHFFHLNYISFLKVKLKNKMLDIHKTNNFIYE